MQIAWPKYVNKRDVSCSLSLRVAELYEPASLSSWSIFFASSKQTQLRRADGLATRLNHSVCFSVSFFSCFWTTHRERRYSWNSGILTSFCSSRLMCNHRMPTSWILWPLLSLQVWKPASDQLKLFSLALKDLVCTKLVEILSNAGSWALTYESWPKVGLKPELGSPLWQWESLRRTLLYS